MAEHDAQVIDSEVLAQQLLGTFGSFYAAARELGDPNLRASLWRLLNEDGFRPSKRFLSALWGWANVEPVVIEAPPGTPLFGDVGLLKTGKVIAILILPPEEWERHSITCAVCGKRTPRWSPSQRYCPSHSWSTREGRQWHRQHKKESQG